MRDHDNGNATFVELLKNSHDFDARSAVEVTSRLIRKHDFGLVDQRAPDRNALLLTT